VIKFTDIRQVHLEISTRCNAACPDCPRNLRGVDVIESYPVLDMSLLQAQQIFTQDFLKQLHVFLINGNYGDFITARDGVEIVEYVRQSSPECIIEISTNASGKPKIWEKLASLGVSVKFRLDGLANTHHLYRQNTDYDLIISNAKKFISAAKNYPQSRAIWTMIPFDHNRHQIDACKNLSKELGFHDFEICDAGRNIMPVFDSKCNFTHIIGDYQGSKNFDDVMHEYANYISDPETELKKYQSSKTKIFCQAKENNEIYVSANGEVYPCCWMGFYPNYTSITRPENFQLRPLIYKNNALEHGLETAMAWFSDIEKTWKINSVISGKLMVCDKACGAN
jgi:MoaA/NifB/PqqE/SkfB family radical SAM enzyme